MWTAPSSTLQKFVFLIAVAVFTRSLGWAYITIIILCVTWANIPRSRTYGSMQVLQVVVVVVVGGCENRFTGYLRGMCRIYERVAYFHCVTTMYIIMYIYARYTRVWWILYIHFFFLVTNRGRRCGRIVTVCIRRTVYVRSEVDHYYRNLTSQTERKKNKKKNTCEKWFSARARPFEAAASLLQQVSARVFRNPPPPWKVHATGYCYRGTVVMVVDGGGGGVLPAFPGRFSHHRGIHVSYINSWRPQ